MKYHHTLADPIQTSTRRDFGQNFYQPGRTNTLAPGPDKIGYRLLRLIKLPELGQALLQDIARCTEDNMVGTPNSWRKAQIDVIPSPGNGSSKVKSWRPIVVTHIHRSCGRYPILATLSSAAHSVVSYVRLLSPSLLLNPLFSSSAAQGFFILHGVRHLLATFVNLAGY